MIKDFPGEAKEFVSYDTVIDDMGNYYQEEFLNTLLPNGIPLHSLLLKQNFRLCCSKIWTLPMDCATEAV